METGRTISSTAWACSSGRRVDTFVGCSCRERCTGTGTISTWMGRNIRVSFMKIRNMDMASISGRIIDRIEVTGATESSMG